MLRAVAEVPRELFVPPELLDFAYVDRPLPIGEGQTISQPTLVARMCELLALSDSDVVLDVGTGSGYHAALLSRLCRHVYGIELEPRARAAGGALARARRHRQRHGRRRRRRRRPARAGAVRRDQRRRDGQRRGPALLEDQLAVGGRLIAPVARDGHEHLVLARRHIDGIERTLLDAVRFVPLR